MSVWQICEETGRGESADRALVRDYYLPERTVKAELQG